MTTRTARTRPTAAKPKTPANPERRMRLLDVTVQARFAYDDGDALTEVTGQPVRVAAAQWARFAAESFTPADLEVARQQYEASQEHQSQ